MCLWIGSALTRDQENIDTYSARCRSKNLSLIATSLGCSNKSSSMEFQSGRFQCNTPQNEERRMWGLVERRRCCVHNARTHLELFLEVLI